MRTFSAVALPLLILLMAAGCGTRVMVAPRIDLAQHEVIGVIEFTCSAKGELADLVTRRFIDAARRDQGMVRIVRLGSEQQVLKAIGMDRMDEEAYKKLGQDRELNTLIVGKLDVSDVRPSVNLFPSLESISVSADVDAKLFVEMIETASGASLWSASASRTERVGNVSVFGGKDVAFNARDPEKAYGHLVNNLVNAVVRDFQVTYERR